MQSGEQELVMVRRAGSRRRVRLAEPFAVGWTPCTRRGPGRCCCSSRTRSAWGSPSSLDGHALAMGASRFISQNYRWIADTGGSDGQDEPVQPVSGRGASRRTQRRLIGFNIAGSALRSVTAGSRRRTPVARAGARSRRAPTRTSRFRRKETARAEQDDCRESKHVRHQVPSLLSSFLEVGSALAFKLSIARARQARMPAASSQGRRERAAGTFAAQSRDSPEPSH